MDVFAFRNELVDAYERFSRSFVRIRADDIREEVEDAYRSGRFWPEPLLQLNPNFVSGGTVDDLIAGRILDPECGRVFRLKTPDDTFGKPLTLHRHQSEAIDVARRGESYVLTTGTGSGKSLAYFVPIVDDVLRRRHAGEERKGITAIVVYPMNALCNSQREELDKFLRLGYPEGGSPVSFARYTGQESQEERERVMNNPPDILLTNYVMLELIMTRFLPTDVAVRNHASGLRFLVLDELHTYRGRQGADVAMLVRRVRERFNANLQCVGTSATMASEGDLVARARVVAEVATRLFGIPVNPENVITETLEPVTDPNTPIDRDALASAVRAGVPESPTADSLMHHPIAAWIERRLSLEEQGGKLVRLSRPKTIEQAAQALADESGLEVVECGDYLKGFLLCSHDVKNPRGGSFFAFRLHQFLSGAWNVYTTLEPSGERYVTVNGQKFTPGDRQKPLFNLAFCRECGQEYLPVWASTAGEEPRTFSGREISDRSSDEEGERYGYLMPDDANVFIAGDLERYPEEWVEVVGGVPRLRSNYKRYRPRAVSLTTTGEIGGELPAWFIEGTFRFCLRCGKSYEAAKTSDLTKLSALSSEGRSSATTMLTLEALRYLIGTDLDPQAKKLLAFSDNRQDASLQAGHFNDFIQILLLRGALLAAVRSAGEGGLTDETLTQRVLEQLRLDPYDYAANPEAKGIKAETTLKALRDVLGYRLYFDLQRGWRLINPNLEQLELLSIRYRALDDCCRDEEEWSQTHPLLRSLSPEKRVALTRDLLERMRRALCIRTIYLDPHFQEQLRNRSYTELKEPWGLTEDERLFTSAYMVPRSRPASGRSDDRYLYMSSRSAFGRKVRARKTWGEDNRDYPARFDDDLYNAVVDDMLRVLTIYGYVERVELDNRRFGYRIDASVLQWAVSSVEDADLEGSTNRFFRALYVNLASMLGQGERVLHQLEAREHTAQVEAAVRMDREARFRRGMAPPRVIDGQVQAAGLPVLFCSPTMELGVDIATLNTVYLRNAPPTPANYAQRSGRAGRSGQPALVITYCAARSPHDQYFFEHPTRMVAGAVVPPAIDLANEDLVRSHLHAVWLAETNVKLGTSVREVLNLEQADEIPLHPEIREEMERPAVAADAKARARAILSMMERDLTADAAPWNTATWLDHVVNGALRRLDGTFNRWRTLYRATARQMELAHAVLTNAAATERQRQEANDRYQEAYAQQNLLLDTQSAIDSDFATYRYLASEDFLPGYNFPRLPLLAYIPGRREKVARERFLSRPRFLGLSEFGPRAIIYHEGSTYRVRRAILTVRDESSSASARLPTQLIRLCSICGYGHIGEQADDERCVNCDASMHGTTRLSNLYRIEQVATRRATRITSDEEDRRRQGYEMITTLRYAEEGGRLRHTTLSLCDTAGELARFSYGPAATLWRINLGWRRRKNKSVYGFSIDVGTGEWSKDAQASDDDEDDSVRDGTNVQRITPYVEDTKNLLIVSPAGGLEAPEIITLQYALKRGIERLFQLEEAELAAEPLPELTRPQKILFYEAAEGGAGVLTRLVTDPIRVGAVARTALEICHFRSRSGNWTDVDDLENTDKECEAGCYRCLWSYYNQPDHDTIDRKNQAVLDLLCRLTRATIQQEETVGTGDPFARLRNACGSSLELTWLETLRSVGYRLPDQAQHYLAAYDTCPDFIYSDQQAIIYIDGPHHEGQRRKILDGAISRRLADAGFEVIRFPADTTRWPHIFERYAWLFGNAVAPEQPV